MGIIIGITRQQLLLDIIRKQNALDKRLFLQTLTLTFIKKS